MTITSFSGEYRFLSNFWLCAVPADDGFSYPSTEHAYQAEKTLDPDQRQKIRLADTSGIAKRLGRSVTKRPDWDDIKLGVMERLLRHKFTLHPSLKEKLLATGDRKLIEGNTWGDTYWGVCKGTGENNLGKLLMKIREELR